jgi:pimeloyl-ACP methyl ester carboxylesterase
LLPPLEIGGRRLESVWYGPAPDQAPTLVFLHEGLGSVSAWRDFPQRLSEACGCGALVFSRLGYGGSDRAPLPRPARFMHEAALTELPEVLDRTGVREAVLVGHSDGGSIALIYAGSRSTWSCPVRGLLLQAPHVFVEPVCVEAIAAAVRSYRSGDLRNALSRHHATDVDATFRGWSEVWLSPEFRDWNIEAFLPRVEVPILALQGEDDAYGTLRQIEAIAAGAGGFAELVALAKCGHSPHRDRTSRTLEVMASFVRREIFAGASRGL